MRQRVAELAAALDERLRRALRLAVFCDFDGTVAPIVSKPEEAEMLPSARKAFLLLGRSTPVVPVVLSGRSLEDLRRRAGLPGVMLGGNHGLEVEGRGLLFRHPEAVAVQPELGSLCELLERELRPFSGAGVEDKGLTATVHLRHVRCGVRDHAAALVERMVGRSARRWVVRRGLLSLEIRPALDWNKGAAARWILDRTGIPAWAALCLGDDRTDEDLFQTLPEAVSVKVGLEGETAARWRLEGPSEVAELLEWLANRVSQAAIAGGTES